MRYFQKWSTKTKTAKVKCKITEQSDITLKQIIHKTIPVYKIHSQVWFKEKAIVQRFNIAY